MFTYLRENRKDLLVLLSMAALIFTFVFPINQISANEIANEKTNYSLEQLNESTMKLTLENVKTERLQDGGIQLTDITTNETTVLPTHAVDMNEKSVELQYELTDENEVLIQVVDNNMIQTFGVWQCSLGTAGGAGLGGLSGFGVATIPGAVVGTISGGMAGAAASCF